METRRARRSGSTLTNSAQNTVIPSANSRTGASTPTSSRRGSDSAVPALCTTLMLATANNTPVPPPSTLSESVLLSVLGGGTGVLLAVASMRVVQSAGTALSLPRLEDVGVDAPVLLFALGITVFCALFVSVLPLLRARRVSITQVLRRAGTGPAGSRAPQRVRSALVVSQIALAVVLVTLSGLMTRSLLRLHDVRPGFEADHVVTSRVLLPYARYSGGYVRLNFFKAMVREAQAIPGARDVALTDWVPLSGDRHDMAIDVEDDPSQANV